MAKKPIVLITNRFDDKLRQRLPTYQDVDFRYKEDLFDDEEALKKAKALIIRSNTQIDQDLLSKLPQLQFIVTATSGFDHIDLVAAARKNVGSAQ